MNQEEYGGIQFEKGRGRYYFDLYCKLYPTRYVDGRIDMELMRKETLEFEEKIVSGEIAFDDEGNFVGSGNYEL